jgi:hypothetical protein
VYLDGIEPPPEKALDSALQGLSVHQGARLSSDSWDADLERLLTQVESITRLQRIQRDSERNPNGGRAGTRLRK